MTNTISLAGGFPAADEAAWRALVVKALRGADFEKTLVSRTYDDLRIDPLYTSASAEQNSGGPGPLPYTRGFRATQGDSPWTIAQLHADSSPEKANSSILEDLNGGVRAIALQLAAPGQFGLELSGGGDLGRALDGVFLDFAPVYLAAGTHFAQAASALQAVWKQKGIAPEKVSGGFDADPVGALARTGNFPVATEQALTAAARLALSTRDTFPELTAILVDARPYHDGGASEAQELACLCATLVAYLRTLEAAGLEPGQGLRQIRFALSCDTDQFLSIAKLRAARTLVSRIAEACGAGEAASNVSLHATTSYRMMTRRDPWTNILRTTMACSAAALGGAETITVLPFTWASGQPDSFARRIARNIQIVLQEESALGAVIDPAGGSWYVEKLTADLAAEAWKIFRRIESQGGILKSLASGFIQTMVRETAKKRYEATAVSRDELVGITAYPKICERPLLVEPHPLPRETDNPAITVEPIPPQRPAEAFDRLREASNMYFDRFGRRPKIFLANLGEMLDFAAPSAYAERLFATGGIEVLNSEALSSASETAAAFEQSKCKVACICSGGDAWDGLAKEAATALTKAGAEHIYLAGRPGEHRAELRKAGVGTFVHKGCDIVETLHEAHLLLGVKPV